MHSSLVMHTKNNMSFALFNTKLKIVLQYFRALHTHTRTYINTELSLVMNCKHMWSFWKLSNTYAFAEIFNAFQIFVTHSQIPTQIPY